MDREGLGDSGAYNVPLCGMVDDPTFLSLRALLLNAQATALFEA
jgi:hypothetical protein